MTGDMAPEMAPEERVEILDTLLRRGIPVYTRYRSRRVVEIRQEGNKVAIRYEDGGADVLSVAHFMRRKFVAII